MPVVYTGMYKGERFNSISHLIGAALALAGGAVLVTYAAMDGDTRKILSYSVYGFTLFLLYLFSTLYHTLDGPAKGVLRVLDHQAIYLLIAGTYTPFHPGSAESRLGLVYVRRDGSVRDPPGRAAAQGAKSGTHSRWPWAGRPLPRHGSRHLPHPCRT
jgi:hypothetical protein